MMEEQLHIHNKTPVTQDSQKKNNKKEKTILAMTCP